MRTVSYRDASQSLSTTMDSVIEDRVPILITRQRGGNCVLLSQEDYESMEETACLERERIHLLLIEDAERGLADIAAGRFVEADEALSQLQQRRAAAKNRD
ncbi:antitoxin [Betaproteobacteria bacterium]|nr:antitoxin [Betaproteobacteria bacterium]